MIRSVLSVLAGIVVLTVTSFAIEAAVDPLLARIFSNALPDHAAITHNLPASLFMFFYTSLCVVAGGYVTGYLARRHPAMHAVVMGAVQAALTVWAMISFPPDVAPLRNWIVAILLAIPTAWLGGFLRAKQLERRASA
jgi:hypothetical protein